MIYYKADINKKIIMFTHSEKSASDYNLTSTCSDDGLEESWDGSFYLKGYAPQKPKEVSIKEQIEEIEKGITDRNVRNALLGDEYALNKMRAVESEIAELRKQLESDGGQQ
jgi:nitrogen regulatory protein PII-like uncharacterized protein